MKSLFTTLQKKPNYLIIEILAVFFSIFISCKKKVNQDLLLKNVNIDLNVLYEKTGIDTSNSLTVLISQKNINGSKCTRIGNGKNIDDKFPFSKIRLCNISRQSPKIIIYSDNSNFSTDGKNGDVMVEIPKIYLKRVMYDDNEYISISHLPKKGYLPDPAFIENGKEIDHIYIGAYHGFVQNDLLKSVSNEKPNANYSLNAYRTYAKNNGKGYGLLDARSLFLIQRLFILYFADRNSQIELGSGITQFFWQSQSATLAQNSENNTNKIQLNIVDHKDRNFKINQICAVAPFGEFSLNQKRIITKIQITNKGYSEISFSGNPVNIISGISRIYSQVQKNGLSDNFIGPNGNGNYFKGSKSSGTEAVKFLNIENLWGNVWTLIDGMFVLNLKAYIGENMDDYDSIMPENIFKKLNYSIPLQNENKQNKEEEARAYIAQLGYDTNYPAYSLPTKIGSTASPTSGYSDPFYSKADQNEKFYAANGGGFDHHMRAGLFTLRIWWNPNQSNSNLHGSRLQFKNY